MPSDQTYSNPVPPNKNFSMIVMSDVQYGYTDCSGAGNILNDTGREDECIYGADLPSNVPDAEAERRLKILIEANKRMVEYGETLISSAPSGTFKGIILNGDMVNYGDSEHLSEYMKLFDDPHAPLSVPVYSSVGNHDVDFGTDDQMMTMSLYFVDYLKRMQSKGLLRSLDGSTTGTFYDVSKARNERHHVGSWSYAFDMGKYTFLQLNNVAFTSDPQRTDRFKKVLANWNGAAAREDYFYFTDAAPWFIKELDLATRRGQHVVLMSHAHYEFQAMLNKPENCEIAKAIAKSSVFVYIAGHIHTRVGKLLNLTLGKGAIKIPVLFAGSPFWEKFVHLDFRADGSGLNFKVADSKRSEPVCDPAVFGCRTVDGVSGFIPTKQDTWTCNKGYFGTKDGCDCGCGMVDPDCLCPGALLYCQNGRSRSNSRCDLITNSCVVK